MTENAIFFGQNSQSFSFSLTQRNIVETAYHQPQDIHNRNFSNVDNIRRGKLAEISPSENYSSRASFPFRLGTIAIVITTEAEIRKDEPEDRLIGSRLAVRTLVILLKGRQEKSFDPNLSREGFPMRYERFFFIGSDTLKARST